MCQQRLVSELQTNTMSEVMSLFIPQEEGSSITDDYSRLRHPHHTKARPHYKYYRIVLHTHSNGEREIPWVCFTLCTQ